MFLKRISILLFCLVIVISCDAPRLNPLDPENPDYNNSNKETEPTYSIEGTIKTLAAPSSPIYGVNISWPNENKVLKTNELGNFTIDDIKKENGWLYFTKDEYYSDSIFVEWNTDTTFIVQKFLKTLPTVNSFSIYTEVQNSHSAPSYHIGFETEITDKDGVVDSVIIYNKDLNIYKSLPRRTFNQYNSKYKISELQLSSIENAVGRDFNLIFVDNQNNKIIAAKEKIARVINQEIVFISPINGNVVSSTPTLTWKKFTPGFKFHYMIQVWTDETGASLVFEQNNISSEDFSFTLPTPIDNEINGIDAYYWVIWSIDEFNNKNRSRQASFVVN